MIQYFKYIFTSILLKLKKNKFRVFSIFYDGLFQFNQICIIIIENLMRNKLFKISQIYYTAL